MNIFIIPSFYKNDKRTEQCIFIYEQAKGLVKAGHTVYILSVQPVLIIKEKPYKSIKEVNDNGVITMYINMPLIYRPNKHPNIYAKQFSTYIDKLFKWTIAKYGMPDVLYAHFTLTAGYSSIKIADKYKLPLVIEEHHSKLNKSDISKIDLSMLSASVNRASKFICVSNTLKEAIVNNTKTTKHIDVISNMIDPCFTYLERQENKKFVFLSIGSLKRIKGFDILIEAFAKEFMNDDDVMLRIAGSGVEYEHLFEQIRKLNAEDKIQLIGQLSRAETLEEYKKCNCFAMASRSETFGIVYREALAVGRPIVSTKHGGFSDDDWYDDYGILVDIDSVTQLRTALRKIFNEYKKYDGKRISELCLNSCSEKVVIEKIVTILTEAVEAQTNEN